MIVTTISKERINTISLPEKVKGRYWLYEAGCSDSQRLASIEGQNGKWIIKSNRRVKLMDDNGKILKNSVISPLNIYTLVKENGDKVCAFVEPITEDRQIFTKYLVRDDMELTVGRADRNDICFANRVVSSGHAVLKCSGGKWSVKDLNSTNGTFVNESIVSAAGLSVGDTVFIMGLKIVIGKQFIAINNPDGKVTLSSKFHPFVNQPVIPADEDEEYEAGETEYFYRSPRFKRDVERAEFKLDAPPASPLAEEMPWLLVMGSSIAMGVMSLVTLVTAIISNNLASMVMGGSMLAGTVFLPMITKMFEKKRKLKKEALRQKLYREYLEQVAAQINDACVLQAEILNENNLTVKECEEIIKNKKRNLWERGLGQNDFLRVRVGHGDGVLDADIKCTERKFTLETDVLAEELYMVSEGKKVLKDIPTTYSLYENNVSGVVGARRDVVEFAKGFIIQLAALYGYDETKFVFIYDKEEAADFGFTKWLPHVWSDDNRFRFICTDANEVKETSAYFEAIIEERSRIKSSDMEDVKPYYVFFSLSKSLTARADMINRVLASKENIHMSVVFFCDELNNLPKECSMVVELGENTGKLYDKNNISGKIVEFSPNIKLESDPLELSVVLANTFLSTSGVNFKLPKVISFLELFDVGKVEHLNALTRWHENDPTKSLQAAVGIDTFGETFMLDLHEKFHGPHGLVAGMTGSGKSEFIITYILSLAVNYHPNEVAFILIDYKGGGMAKSFEKLPHTAGIITNLDGAAIKRSLTSIESELKRRQAVFAKVSKKLGISNIDIYKYQKLYREGTVTEPLQHLFIISDEFAELKTQQPEFMAQLVSAARIGRSLGVHLILATQKPSGVVDDQIWSNSKFRVCLKVQERSDSMDMLKRPDAAELIDTGRFYLQVGYNELFEMGQSAWAGATYYPSDKVLKEKDNSVVVIDNNGHYIKQVKPDKKRVASANSKKQLDVITEYLTGIAAEEGIKIRPLWLEPIPPVILLESVKEKYGIRSEAFVLDPIVGEYDDPARQRQCAMSLPLSREGNAIVYGVAGSGKTTFLNAMLYSLIQDHTPDEVNIYVLDFAAETLRAFAKAPHVGDVVLSYETEKVGNLFKMLQKELERRKKLFADYGGDYRTYVNASGSTVPSIVVAINNFAAFTEIYEDKEEAVAYLSREGTKYGIYFVLTAAGAGSVRFRLLQNFKQLLVLQLNDESDYSSIVGKTDGLFPSKYKGRGLVKLDELYEFQLARVTEEVPFAIIQDFCQKADEAWGGASARRIPVLPETVDLEFIKEYADKNKKAFIPIGVDKNTLGVHYHPFGKSYINMVLSAGNEHQNFTCGLTELIGTEYGFDGVVLDTPKTVTDSGSLKLCHSAAECEAGVSKLFELLVYRNNTFKDSAAKGEAVSFEDYYVIITSLSALKLALSEEGNQKLSLVLEKGCVDYNVTVIFAEQSKNLTAVSFEKWYKANITSADGIWVGNGITEQYNLKASKTVSSMHEDMGEDFGYALQNGKWVKVKLLKGRMEVNGNEQ